MNMEQTRKYQNFTDLNVWKEARIYQLFIFNLCKTLPKEEKYNLCDQMVRASRSIAANIAEGHGRFHFQEQIQFCRQARGSLAEVLNHIFTAFDCAYLTDTQVKELEQMNTNLLRLLNGYLLYLKNQKLATTNQPINKST